MVMICLFGFDPGRNRGQRKLTKNKNQNWKHHMRMMIKAVFGFAEHQEKAKYGLGFEIALTRNNDSSVLNKTNATNNAKNQN